MMERFTSPDWFIKKVSSAVQNPTGGLTHNQQGSKTVRLSYRRWAILAGRTDLRDSV